jgi:hypothetical protein
VSPIRWASGLLALISSGSLPVASTDAVCYDRFTSIRAIRSLATNVRSGSGRRARGIFPGRPMGLPSTMAMTRADGSFGITLDV